MAGFGVENQTTAEARLPWLLQTPAAVRFVSYEPALGPVDFSPYLDEHGWPMAGSHRGLDWIIAGGERGPAARPCDLAWLRSVVQQCQTADVACFIKQLGSHAYEAARRVWLRHQAGADPAAWPAELRCQQFPKGPQG